MFSKTNNIVFASALFIISSVICIAEEDTGEHGPPTKPQQQNAPSADEHKPSTPYDNLLGSWKIDPNTATTVDSGEEEFILIRISGEGFKYVPKSLVEVKPLHSSPETKAHPFRTAAPEGVYPYPNNLYTSNDYSSLLTRIEKLETIVTEQSKMLTNLLKLVTLQGESE